MQFLSVFPDITKIVNFRRRNAGVSRTEGVCHVIYTFFGSFLGITMPSFIIVGYV